MNYAHIMSSSKYTNSKKEYQLVRFVDVIQLSKSKLMIFVQIYQYQFSNQKILIVKYFSKKKLA